jgi:protein gp37
MKNTKIEWCDHTFNGWEGCTKVSPGCANCYAENRNARFGGGTAPNWGKGAPRRRTSADNWKQPLKWDREAAEAKAAHDGEDLVHAAYVRPRVFCASLADWLDDEVPTEWLADLLDLIRRTPNLDWLLLTKRPQNWQKRIYEVIRLLQPKDDTADALLAWVFEWYAGRPPANVWVGTSVEDQTRANERIPLLLEVPAKVRFLSMEPLLGEVRPALKCTRDTNGDGNCDRHPDGCPRIHWVVLGGESGTHARPMHPDWARSVRNQCKAAGVAYFHKQNGEWREPQKGEEFDTSLGRVGKPPAFIVARDGTVHCFHDEGTMEAAAIMIRAGKKAAGRLLDGVEHNGFPGGVS